MKHRILFAFLSIFVLLTGCIKEDMDDCGYTDLYFSYKGDGTSEIFSQKIEKVNLYVFDIHQQHLSTYIIEQNELDMHQGTSLNLRPGRYHIVCIGNAHDNTQISNLTDRNMEEILIAHPNYFSEAGNIPGNDSIYWSKIEIEVPENRALKDTVCFSTSHVDISIEIRGLNCLPGTVQLIMNNVTPCTSFTNQLCGDYVSYYPELEHDPVGNKFNAQFCTPRCCTKDSPISFQLKKTMERCYMNSH